MTANKLVLYILHEQLNTISELIDSGNITMQIGDFFFVSLYSYISFEANLANKFEATCEEWFHVIISVLPIYVSEWANSEFFNIY